MRILETKIYEIGEHPDEDKCFEWIRENWHDLNEHSLYEVIDSIKALSMKIGGSVDYSISVTPCRGEYIRFEGYDKAILNDLDASDCPLTGVCWDVYLIEGLKEGYPCKVLTALHADTEYYYSDDGLRELCEANAHEFSGDGEMV